MTVDILMAIYQGDDPGKLARCLRSLARQSRVPERIVLVQDGPIDARLRQVVDHYHQVLNIEPVVLPDNRGLVHALNAGLAHCTHEVVLRMDSDDECSPDRVKLQLEFLDQHPGVSVVGGSVVERDKGRETLRTPPLAADEVIAAGRFRNPVYHMTVACRRADVTAVGGYPALPDFEDYALWLRLLDAGRKVCNIADVLCYVDFDDAVRRRRAGLRYLVSELKFYGWARRHISAVRLSPGFLLRAMARLLPGFALVWAYKLDRQYGRGR